MRKAPHKIDTLTVPQQLAFLQMHVPARISSIRSALQLGRSLPTPQTKIRQLLSDISSGTF